MRNRKIFIGYFIVVFALLIGASLWDYEISSFLYNRTSLICRSIHIIAQTPTFLLLTFFSLSIFTTRNRDGSISSMLSALFGVIGAIVFGFMSSYIVLYNIGLYSVTFTMAICVGIYASCYILTTLICDRHLNELRKLSKLGLYSFLVILIIHISLTTVFERITYRRLDGLSNIFMNWYHLDVRLAWNGFMNRSFPSLTVELASLTLLIQFFTGFLRVFKERRFILFLVIVCWALIVIISQLVLGYAYLSDAMIALIIGNVVMGIFYFIIYKYKKEL